jgi:tetratricopeptide (TPR) repeat protein
MLADLQGDFRVTVSEAIPLRRYAGRTLAAAGIIFCLGLAYAAYQARQGEDEIAPFIPTHAVTHEVAAANQQGQPTSYAEQLAATNHKMGYAQAYADRLGTDVGAWSDLANLYLGRARLTGSFDDYAMAGKLYDKAFSVAKPRYGPHLDRAIFNFTVHRLNLVEPDLVAVDHYAVPEPGPTATVQGLRGDLAFYSGHYPEALALYRKSHTTLVMMSTSFRLAYYWGRMGDPDKARRYLDEAESQVIGPQQQQRSFLEMYRGILSLDHGQWGDAETHFRKADAIFPGHWLVQEHLAMVLALRGHPSQAMALYQDIFQRTNMPEAADAVAGLYRATGDFAGAKAWAARADTLWRQRLALLPEAAYGHLVDHLLAFGTPAETLQVALKNYQSRPYADAATQLGWAYLANHDPSNALKVLGPTLASGWVSAEPHIVAYEAHALLGQGPAADAERKAALTINPHSLDRNPGLVWLEQ